MKKMSRKSLSLLIACPVIVSLFVLPVACSKKTPAEKVHLASLIGVKELGEINGIQESTIKNAIEEKNSGINFIWNEIILSNITSVSAELSSDPKSANYFGETTISYIASSHPTPIKMDLSNLIRVTNLGAIQDNSESMIHNAIDDVNSIRIWWDEVLVLNVTRLSATIMAHSSSVKYSGSVNITFITPDVRQFLSTLIIVTDLGELTDNNVLTIKNTIDSLNRTALVWNQIVINSITDIGATITAKSDSTLYEGNVNVSFTIVPGKDDLADIINEKNLGEIANNSESTIKTAVDLINGISLSWNDVIISNITGFRAIITAKNISEIYYGTVTVNFSLPDLRTPIGNIITTRNLGPIVSNSTAIIKMMVETINNVELTWTQLIISDIGETSATITATDNSTIYIGTINVFFTVSRQELSNFIQTTSLGEIANTDLSTIRTAIDTINSVQLVWSEINIANITTSSALIYANSSSTRYQGEVRVYYSLPAPAVVLSTLVTTTFLGNLPDNTQSTLRHQIESLNSVSLVWTDIVFSNITISGGTITALSTSTRYTGSVDFTFNLPNLKSLNSVVTLTNLGQIDDTNDATIRERVDLVNSKQLTWADIDIDNVTSTRATLIAKPGSYVYTGTVDVTFTIANQIIPLDKLSISGALLKGFVPSYTPPPHSILNVPNEITDIDDEAFNGQTNIVELNLGTSVETIGMGAFAGCTGITGGLVIPNSVTSIGANAFNGCNGFSGTLTLSSNLVNIWNFAFAYCQGFIGGINIPNSVTVLGTGVFYGCSGFNGTITFSSALTSLPQDTFNGCINLVGSLEMPNSITTINSYAFNNCAKIRTISTRASIIAQAAFKGCVGITSLYLTALTYIAYQGNVVDDTQLILGVGTIRVASDLIFDYQNPASGWPTTIIFTSL